METENHTTHGELQHAAIIVRNDLSILVTVQDQSIELHLDPLQALGLGKRLIELGLAMTGDDKPMPTSTQLKESQCNTH